MDSRRDFTSKKVFSGYFSELGEKANSALPYPWVFWDPLLHIKLGFAANPLVARGRGSTATKISESHRNAQIFNHA